MGTLISSRSFPSPAGAVSRNLLPVTVLCRVYFTMTPKKKINGIDWVYIRRQCSRFCLLCCTSGDTTLLCRVCATTQSFRATYTQVCMRHHVCLQLTLSGGSCRSASLLFVSAKILLRNAVWLGCKKTVLWECLTVLTDNSILPFSISDASVRIVEGLNILFGEPLLVL